MTTSIALPDPILYCPSLHTHFLPSIVQIHQDCVIQDHTLLTFLPPLSTPKLLSHWTQKSAEVASGTRLMVLQPSPKGDVVAGVVMLDMPPSETGPFRGVVERLMVSPRYRRMGIAKRLMGKLEQEARERGRGLLLLDTPVGSEAEQVYPKLGYKSIGVVPRYGISPEDGRLVDERFFYKDLRDEQ